jgi:hypothetical protein
MQLHSHRLPSLTAIAATLTLLAATLVPTAVLAKDIYRGQGYTVTIGDDGSYYGCDARKRCLFIESYAHRERGGYVWENRGFTYIMMPIDGTKSAPNGVDDRYSLKVINPQGQVILKRVLNPMGVGG